MKILFKDSSSKSVKETKLQCLNILGVMNVLPPPGSPIAETNKTFCIFLNGFSLSFKSYQPPWSKNCLKSSIGGYAPQTSLEGIFKSSTNNMHLPNLGP